MPNTLKLKQIDQTALTAFIVAIVVDELDGLGAVYTANRALVSNSLGDVVVSAVTNTELGYVSGVTSSLQTQLNSKQSLDATLTAIAALTIAANTLTIGTGADTFSQTTFAANTFPARASTGNLEAKTVSDFGLSIVDDTNAAAARTTLGLVIGTDVAAQSALASYLPLAGGTLTAASASVNILTLQQYALHTGAGMRVRNSEGYTADITMAESGSFRPLVFNFGVNDGYQCGIKLQRAGVDKIWTYPSNDGPRMKCFGGNFEAFMNDGVTEFRMMEFTAAGVVRLSGSNTGDVEIYAHTALKQKFTGASLYDYYSYTDASNYQGAKLTASAGAITLEAITAGTGADDIDVVLTPAGAGVVQFGTHEAIGAETVSGFITIKDAGGTSRKIAVVS